MLITNTDVCGGLISSEKTLMPVHGWAPGNSLNEDVRLFRDCQRYDVYANLAIYLCAQVLDVSASRDVSVSEFTSRWNALFSAVEDWYLHRPAEMESILESAPTPEEYSSPFSRILFSNPAAISGNQMYHTASILMLQMRPPGACLSRKSRSLLWHARRVCAISISNTHHGCWTNCIQPLWIAGQVMSHPAEHHAILSTYERIEKETGWGANWRAKDLQTIWGQLDED